MPTDPDHAQAIATHTQALLRSMRVAPTRDTLQSLYADWLDYANSNSVVEPIRSHVAATRAECERNLRSRASASSAQTARRMTGEGQ